MNHRAQSVSTERRTLWEMILACSGSPADRRNQYWILVWGLVWGIGFVAAALALRPDVGLSRGATWAIALTSIALFVPPLLAYLHFLRMTDELLRKIQLEGLALGFGAGAIFGLGYPLLEEAGAPDASDSTIVVVMMVAWALGQFLGLVRYR